MTAEAIARRFRDLVALHEDGQLDDDATKALEQIVENLNQQATDGIQKPKAKLTLTFDIGLDRGQIDVVADLAVKMAKVKRRQAVYWSTHENQLTRDNPRQMNMDLRRVGDTRETRQPASAG